MVLRAQTNGTPDEADGGECWGCLVQDRPIRFIAACATGCIGDDLVEHAVTLTVTRTQGRPLTWCSDGGHDYAAILRRAYRQSVRLGQRGRPRPRVPPDVRLTQTIKHRDEHGKLLSIEIRAEMARSGPRTGHRPHRARQRHLARSDPCSDSQDPCFCQTGRQPSMLSSTCNSLSTTGSVLIGHCASRCLRTCDALGCALLPWPSDSPTIPGPGSRS